MRNFINLIFVLLSINQIVAQVKMPVPNGPVHSIVRNGNTIYYGGEFNSIGYPTGSPVLVDYQNGSGTMLPSTLNSFPKVIGSIKCMEKDGKGGWFVGGDFTSIGGYSIFGLSHLDSLFQVDTMFNSQLNGEVRTIVVDGDIIYIGGTFTEIQGIENNYVAKIENVTGGSYLWNAQCDGPVNSMVLNNGNLAIGGEFQNLGGLTNAYLGIIDLVYAQSLHSWSLDGKVNKIKRDSLFNSYIVVGEFSYNGGAFNFYDDFSFGNMTFNYYNFNQYSRNGYRSLDGNWISSNNGINGVSSIKVKDVSVNSYTFFDNYYNSYHTVYHIFQLIEITFYDGNTAQKLVNERYDRYNDWWGNNVVKLNSLLFLNLNSGGLVNAMTPTTNGVLVAGNDGRLTFFDFDGNQTLISKPANDPFVYSTQGAPNAIDFIYSCGNEILLTGPFTGVTINARINAFAVNATTGQLLPWAPNPNGTVRALAVDPSKVYLGGDFTTVNGTILKNRLAQVDTINGVATTWNPGSDGQVNALLYKSNVLYVGGKFSKIGGLTKKCVGALNTLTGTATSFNYPMDTDVSNEVTSFAITNDTLFIGGNFKNTASKQYGLGAVRLNSTILNYQNALSSNLSDSRLVKALSLKNNRLYVGGDFDMKFYSNATTLTDKHNFTVIDIKTKNTLSYAYTGGGIVTALAATPDNSLYIAEAQDQVSTTFNSLAVLNATGTIAWNPEQDGNVNNLFLYDDKVYVGGSFININKVFNPYFATLNKFSMIEIYSVAPLTACINSDITVYGKGFNNIKSVKIGTTNFSFTAMSDTMLIVKSTNEVTGRLDLTSLNDIMTSSLDVINVINPQIIGSSSVCIGSNLTLSHPIGGGVWSIQSGTNNLTLSNDVFTGKIAGSAVVQYAITSPVAGCPSFVNKTITINAKPSAGILGGTLTSTGKFAVCPSTKRTITTTVGNGIWSSSNNAIASVINGVVTGVSVGTTFINYTVTDPTTGCSNSVARSVIVDVIPATPVIYGTNIMMCQSGKGFITASLPNGTWSSIDTYLKFSTLNNGMFYQQNLIPSDNYISGVKYSISSTNRACTSEATKEIILRKLSQKSVTITAVNNKTNLLVNEEVIANVTTTMTATGVWRSFLPLSLKVTVNPSINKQATVKGLAPGNNGYIMFQAKDLTTGCSNGGWLSFNVTASQSIVDVNTTSLVSSTSGIHLYPNPSNGKFTIDNIEGATAVKLLDLTGRVIAEEPVSKGISSFDFSNVSTGKYMVQITGETLNEIQPIVIE